MYWFRKAITAAGCLVLSCLLICESRPCEAEPWSFDPQRYASLADGDSAQTIAPGTRIAAKNWQEYRAFLPVGIQALFSGAYPWRIPAGPQGEMLVGPTVAIPFPYRYQRDTEKYAGSTRLVRSGENRMAIDGYVAGLPFPNLRRQDPDAVYKLIYDMYFRYHPAILVYHQRALFFDTYLNRTPTVATAVEFRLGHISDEGFPLSEPLAPSDVFFTSNVTVEAPEQSKYTVNLQIYYDDPNRIQDIYTYIPSLRRSIRRSSAARCSPMVAGDILQDDIYARPILYDQFSYRLLGRKKVLQQAHLDLRHMFDEESFNFGGVPGWPKPLMGPWEVRSVWLIDETTLPSNSDYCYGRRITYVDGDTLIPLETDIYDQGGRLWKVLIYSVSPAPIQDGHESVSALSNARVLMVDLLSSHATVSSQVQPGQVNEQVPVKYRDVQMWALPAGLSQASR